MWHTRKQEIAAANKRGASKAKVTQTPSGVANGRKRATAWCYLQRSHDGCRLTTALSRAALKTYENSNAPDQNSGTNRVGFRAWFGGTVCGVQRNVPKVPALVF